jgi:hypothetical protein
MREGDLILRLGEGKMKFCFWSLSNVAVVFLLVVVGVAQSGDWATVQALAPGEQIKVALQNGDTIHGKFQSASETDLVVARAAGQKPLTRENVRSVSIKHSHRGRHALIGAAIGAGAGLGLGASIDNDCTKTSFVCTGNRGKAILTPAFALIGAGIGAALPSGGWQHVYVK